MTDLIDLKREIAELHLDAPPLAGVLELGRRNRRRRAHNRLIATALAVVVLAVVLVFVTVQGNSSPITRAGAAPYVGTASAAFVTQDGDVYVADQGNDSLVELDPGSSPPFELVSTIPLAFTPGVVAISPDGSTAIVSPLVPEFEGGSNTLYEINLATHHVTRKIVDHSQPLGSVTIAEDGTNAYAWGDDVVPVDLSTGRIGTPIATSSGEYTDFAIAPEGEVALATIQGPHPECLEIDLATGTVAWTASTSNLGGTRLSGFWTPEDVAFSPDGSSAYVTVEQEDSGSSRSGLLTVSVKTGKVISGTSLGGGGVGNVVVTPDGKKAFVVVQVDVPHVYSGAFTVVPVDLTDDQPNEPLVIGDGQALGLLQISLKQPLLFAVDTQWKVTGIDEQTDRLGRRATIPVPSLLAPTLQPIAFGG